jgi:hypothetical protein
MFTVTGIAFGILKNWDNAVIFLGLAPIFDPFPPLPFQKRPGWQRTWLYVHMALTTVAIGLLIRGFLH